MKLNKRVLRHLPHLLTDIKGANHLVTVIITFEVTALIRGRRPRVTCLEGSAQ